MDDRPWTDEQLAAAAQSAENAELRRQHAAQLLGRYRKAVYLWCFRHTHEHEDALDLAQDALLKAFEKLDSFQGDSRFSTWLFVLTRNTCLSALRRKHPRWADATEIDELADPAGSPEEELLEREGEAALLHIIHDTLEPQEQRALWMRCVERRPVQSITEALQLDGASGARGLLQTARRKLRAAMAGERRSIA